MPHATSYDLFVDMTDVSVTIPLSMLGLTADTVNAADEKGETALHRAACQGSEPAVLHVIRVGAHLDSRAKFKGRTPLHLAAAAGHAGLLPLLITPATLDAHDDDHQTPLQLAVRQKRLEAATVLVAAGASLGGADFAATPLASAFQIVAQGGPSEVALMLLSAMMANSNSAGLVEKAVRWQQAGGVTALHTAASWGHKHLVAKLLEAGADRDAVTQLGATPLWCAAAAGHAALVPLLATFDNINKPGPGPGSQPSPLSLAMQWGDTQMLSLMVQAVAKQCSQQQEQNQQQPQQQGQAKLVQLLATAYVAVPPAPISVSVCACLLGVVLDVLGSGVAGNVCQVVQQQLQEAFDDPQMQPHRHPAWMQSWKKSGCQVSYLAEALLLGWVWAEERLHAARQPLVARLQRLVVQQAPGQQQELHGHGHKQLQQPQATSMLDWEYKGLVQQAEFAAADGQQQAALRLLGEVAALQLRRPEFQAAGQSTRITSSISTHSKSISTLLCEGLHMAAYSRMGLSRPNSQVWDPVAYQRIASFRPAGVYTTFLVAWGRARRQLQQLPQEVARTVVSAVKAAREDQEQQVLDGEEERLCDDLLALLLLPPPQPADAAGAAGHGA
jgi:ankyrin repeat protein